MQMSLGGHHGLNAHLDKGGIYLSNKGGTTKSYPEITREPKAFGERKLVQFCLCVPLRILRVLCG